MALFVDVFLRLRGGLVRVGELLVAQIVVATHDSFQDTSHVRRLRDIGVQGHRVGAVFLRDHDGLDRRRHLCGKVRDGLWPEAAHLEDACLLAVCAAVVHSHLGGQVRIGQTHLWPKL
jgi:hypothetical protein